MKTLIVYGTRYGATTGTSNEIAKVLLEAGFEIKVVNAKEEKIRTSQSMNSSSLEAACAWENGPMRRMIS